MYNYILVYLCAFVGTIIVYIYLSNAQIMDHTKCIKAVYINACPNPAKTTEGHSHAAAQWSCLYRQVMSQEAYDSDLNLTY
jgi:hypothetical protein